MSRRKTNEGAAQVAPESTQVELVRMVRDPSGPLPHACDVHPEEIENYRRGGWQVAKG